MTGLRERQKADRTRRILEAASRLFRDTGYGAIRIEDIANAAEARDAVEDVIEPYLLQQGFIQRTPRGRILTPHAFRHLGLPEPSREAAQFGLFGDGEA